MIARVILDGSLKRGGHYGVGWAGVSDAVAGVASGGRSHSTILKM